MEKINSLSDFKSVGVLYDFLKSDFIIKDLSVPIIRFLGRQIIRYLQLVNQFDEFPIVPSYVRNVPPCQPYRYMIKGSVYRFSHPDSVFKFLINVSCHEKTEGFFDELEKYQFADGSILSRETSL